MRYLSSGVGGLAGSDTAGGRTRLGPTDDAVGLPNQERRWRDILPSLPPKPDYDEPTCHADQTQPVVFDVDLGRCCRTDPSGLTSFLYHSSPDLWGQTGRIPRARSGRGGPHGFPTSAVVDIHYNYRSRSGPTGPSQECPLRDCLPRHGLREGCCGVRLRTPRGDYSFDFQIQTSQTDALYRSKRSRLSIMRARKCPTQGAGIPGGHGRFA
ncbi:uncharacterized protein BO80DRAFT_238397 [Aspergillus ibericus CBS 121593]|uniref:Uncharacterized protein n=1 Tax=Aspergillus ibericus CBS 121593 TaxID=1448316 RepID=A0A395GL55_9EURO|nr:hypothetical protein BO80DRAFT_238397 [Aspergillus ibericus CBS 121593]RAK96245.1 hypothetical protein BO80DRAFT_238397 [Aspergillus ibericus CBS 121593]